ncbi:MAG TPA: DUF4440 domain-containing protein [Gemmatimonadaceae bacterium]|jgi:hypothetical protein|nr:DUF4440 domain-containing protein [Gemmatimonadaceae bacterium]
MKTIAVAVLMTMLASCATPGPATRLTDAQRQAITREITDEVKSAYDLTKPDVVADLLSLYPDSGRIVSASGGRVLTTRDSLAAGLRYFWENVGRNMRNPTWVWDQMLVDVLSPSAAVMTATYHVPHFTPRNEPHVIAGAWTAVFERRGARWVIVQEHLSDLPAAEAMQMAMPMTMAH